MIPILLLVSVATFILVDCTAGDPARVMLQGSTGNPSEESVQLLQQELGLDQPKIVQYFQCSGKYQEIEGPPIALKLLKDCNVPEDMVQRICFLIAHHHTYQSVDDIDYQILIEADFLVNMFEEKMSKEQIQIAKEKYFKTQTGKQLVMDLYEREYPIPSIFASML